MTVKNAVPVGVIVMEQFWIAFFASLPATITAAGAAIAVVLKSWQIEHKIDDNTKITQQARNSAASAASEASQMKTAVNGRMEELLKAEREKAYAEGYAKGKQESSNKP